MISLLKVRGSTLDVRVWRLQMWDSDLILILIFLLAFSAQHYSAVQSQKTVSAYFISEQILPFGFADQYCHMTELFCVNKAE